MLNKFYTVLLIFFIGVTSALFFIVALVIWSLTVWLDRRLIVLHMFSSLWASLYLWVVPNWSIRVQGRRKFDWQDKYVIVSNHQSQLDILLAFRLFIPFKWISKAEVFRLPFIGWNMCLNRYIKLQRGDKASIAQMFAECENALSHGNSIFIFPEGTRSRTGAIQPFKPGAFILARKKKVPILPVVISGTHTALPKHRLVFHGRHRMRIRLLDPVPPERFQEVSVKGLTEHVHGIIADELEKMGLE